MSSTSYDFLSTTGGKGGPTTTVTTLDALISAVAGDTAAIVFISGTITGDAVVLIGSNKTVLGKAGACTCRQDSYPFIGFLLTIYILVIMQHWLGSASVFSQRAT